MEEFLNNYLCENEKDANFRDHTSQHFYSIPNNKLGTFWNMYCDAIFDGNRKNLVRYLDASTPVPLSFEFRLLFDHPRIHSLNEEKHYVLNTSLNEFLISLIYQFQQLIERLFILDTDGNQLMACCCRKNKEKYLTTTIQNEIEFHCQVIFPYAVLPYQESINFYRKTVEPDFNNYIADYLSRITIPSNNNDIFTFPVKNEWCLFGSSYNLSDDTLELCEIYDAINPQDDPLLISIEDAFLIEENYLAKSGTLLIDDSLICDYWIPYFLSPGFEQIPLRRKNILSRRPKIAKDVQITQNSSENNLREEAKRLLPMISPHRFLTKCYWLDIGKALFSIYPDHDLANQEEMFKLWEYYTIKSIENTPEEEYERTVFIEDSRTVWNSFHMERIQGDDDITKITLATLRWYAKQDSREEYEVFHAKELATYMHEALELAKTGPISRWFRAYYEFELLFEPKEKQWYRYIGHRWIQCTETDVLGMYDGFIRYIQIQQHEYSQKTIQSTKSEERTTNHAHVGLLNNIIDKLEGNSFKGPLKSELEVRYSSPHFVNCKDRNKVLFGCRNGVLDLSEGVFFRPGKPEDYITLSGASYMENYSYNLPVIQEAAKYVSEVFTDHTVRSFFWRYIGSCIRGGNDDKKLFNAIGVGNNSKSLIQVPIRAAFGSYFGDMPSTYITQQPKNANDPDAIFSYLANKRFVSSNEPNPEEDVKEGTVKKLSGRDLIATRDLFQKGTSIRSVEPMFTITVFTNEKLNVNSTQQAIWNRMIVIPYESCWVDKSELLNSDGTPMTYEQQYKQRKFILDERFEGKVKSMGPAFLWLAVEGYKDYIKNGLSPPEKIREASENYRTESNMYLRFIKKTMDRVVKIIGEDEAGNPKTMTDDSVYVLVDDAFMAYRNWFREEKISRKTVDRTTFVHEMEKILKKNVVEEEGRLAFTGLRLLPGILPSRDETLSSFFPSTSSFGKN